VAAPRTSLLIAKIAILCYIFGERGGESMNISLTRQLEDLVRSKVESGLYGSASEVMREALRLLEERDRMRSLRLEDLRTEIRRGLDSGEATPLDIGSVKARGRRRLVSRKD
jgi:antitoxin ParD1/3/4